MIEAFLAWLLSISLGGLPIFCSDRFDLYRQGTNDAPLTFAFDPYDSGPSMDAWGCPSGYLWLDLSYEGSYSTATINSAGVSWSSLVGFSANPGDSIWLVDPLHPYQFQPFAFGMQGGPDGTDLFQAEWIEPSFYRLLQHFFAGMVVAMGVDVSMLCIFTVYFVVASEVSKL